MGFYIDTKVGDNSLNREGKWIIIRCEDEWADCISATRKSTDTVEIMNVNVAQANRRKGKGTALVQKLFDELPREVEYVVLGSNDEPTWWRKIKPRISGGQKLVL